MGQISVNSVIPVAEPPPSTPVAPAADRTVNRAVSVAVGQLNEAGYAGAGREVTFSLDPATKQPVIKVIDTATREVIRQMPPEYLLQLAAENTNGSRDSG
ncbi:MAG: flagellar protein FlaG [Bryobacteraceae bacterium]